MDKLKKIIDNILLGIILISVTLIILDDVAVLASWNESTVQTLIIIGFACDVVFSLEFIVRSIIALKNRRFKEYFIMERGWIDLLASLPLLLLNSGPAFIIIVSGTAVGAGSRSIMNLMKVIRAIRVTRILRVLRLLKIFGKIENVMSKMSQHHISTVSIVIVMTTIAVFMTLSLTGVVKLNTPLEDSTISLAISLILIVNIMSMIFFYSGHFAKYVTDPLYIIKRGLTEDDYNFTVKTYPQYAKEEISELSQVYNKVWLPIKVRQVQAIRQKRQQQSSSQSQDDFSDLL